VESKIDVSGIVYLITCKLFAIVMNFSEICNEVVHIDDNSTWCFEYTYEKVKDFIRWDGIIYISGNTRRGLDGVCNIQSQTWSYDTTWNK